MRVADYFAVFLVDRATEDAADGLEAFEEVLTIEESPGPWYVLQFAKMLAWCTSLPMPFPGIPVTDRLLCRYRGFKALKRIIKIQFSLGKHAEVRTNFTKWLTDYSALLMENEKAVNSLLEYLQSSPNIQDFYTQTMERLEKTGNKVRFSRISALLYTCLNTNILAILCLLELRKQYFVLSFDWRRCCSTREILLLWRRYGPNFPT